VLSAAQDVEVAQWHAVGHLLKNARRYRVPGTPITIALPPDGETEPSSVTVKIHNIGPAVAPE
jgi:hypothetical protein